MESYSLCFMRPAVRAILACVLLSACDVASAFNVYAVTPSNVLVRFASQTPDAPSIATITGLGAGENVVGLDFRPSDQKLYALASNTGGSARLYTIDRTTGVATLVVDVTAASADPYTALSGTKFAMNFNPMVDRLRVVSNNGMNIRINPANGLVTTDTPLNPGTPHVVGIAYTNSYVGAASTTLYDIESVSDSLSIQTFPNAGVLSPVGPLGVDTSQFVGFDIFEYGGGNVAYATLTVAGVTRFYAIVLETGTAGLIGNVGYFDPLIAMTILPDRLFADDFD